MSDFVILCAFFCGAKVYISSTHFSSTCHPLPVIKVEFVMSSAASPDNKNFLYPVKALLLEQGLGKTRANILAKQLENKGGEVVKHLSSTTTHILVGNSTRLARVHALLKVDSTRKDIAVLRADWLSACLTKKQLVNEEEYRVYPDVTTTSTSSSSSSPKTTPTKDNSTRPSPASNDGQGVASGNDESPRCKESILGSTDPSLLSPKAGMFSVTGRRWTSQSRTSGKTKAKTAELDSDSDYVESEEGEEGGEEEEQEGDEHGDESAPPTKKVRSIMYSRIVVVYYVFIALSNIMVSVNPIPCILIA